MTEEEKAEAEAGKAKKPPEKKGVKKDEEPSAEELQRWEEEKKERDETNARARAEWDALDDNTRFFRACEDPFKEASIRFVADGTVEDQPDPSVQEAELDSAALRAFESSVCDQKGCWVYFDKHVPREEEAAAGSDPKAKKPPAKAKTQSPEDIQKPTHGRAWLNLTPLLTPGTQSLTQRVFLSQIAPSEACYPVSKRDEGSEFVGSQSAAQQEEEADATSLQDVFMEQQTYAYLTLELSEPLYPQPDFNVIKADGRSLTNKYPEVAKFPSSRQAISEFEDALHFIVQQIGAEYQKMNQEEEKQNQQSTTSLLKAQTTLVMQASYQEKLAEARREKFLTEFTQLPKYLELRNRLKQAIFRLGAEMIKKKTGAAPLSASAKDKLKAELYIFLQTKTKKCLEEAILSTQRSSLHSDIVSQFENISGAREDKFYESFRETTLEKFDRLALEFDTVRDIENAERNFVNHLVDEPNDARKWEEFAQFCLRYGLQIKAE